MKAPQKVILKKKKGYFLEVNIHYPENLYNVQNELLFLTERMNIEKFEKLVANLHDENKCVIHIWSLKQALNHVLILKKVHRAITFNQKAELKSCIKINTE